MQSLENWEPVLAFHFQTLTLENAANPVGIENECHFQQHA